MVALDTNVIIWAMKSIPRSKATARVAEMERRAGFLLTDLEDDKATIVVPNICVAELLIGVDQKDHSQFVAELQNQFFVPTFDLKAATLAASLWLKHRNLPKVDQIARTCLKADVLIIATAKVAGATDFYSNDEKIRKLAELAGLNGRDLPLSPKRLFPK